MSHIETGTDGTIEDRKYLPIPEDFEESKDDLIVDYENWEAFEVFINCSTQWRVISGMATVMQGLDYTSVESVMRMMGIKNKPEIFQKLRLIERGALAEMRGTQLEELLNG